MDGNKHNEEISEMRTTQPMKATALVLALAGTMSIGAVKAQDQDGVQIEQLHKLLKEKSLMAACPYDFPAHPIAVSAFGGVHQSEGTSQLLTYPHQLANEGNKWYGNAAFQPDCAGL